MTTNTPSVQEILEELNIENGSNYKITVLKKYQDHELLKRVFKMTFDRVEYVYGITMKNVSYAKGCPVVMKLEEALDRLLDLNSRKYTGNAAIKHLCVTLEALSDEDQELLKKILKRDLKINLGRTSINKVHKNLISKEPYKRCAIATKATIAKNINFKEGVYSQVKMDGTYRSCTIDGDDVTFKSRSGKEQFFPILKEQILKLELPNGVLTGELTLRGEQNRNTGNGNINSSEPNHENIIFTVWEFVESDEYKLKKGTLKYKDTFKSLANKLYNANDANDANATNIELVEYKMVYSLKEAYEHFQIITARGDEGTVIKSQDMIWMDGTSKQQLKLKLEISLEMRITSFNAGNVGSKNEAYFSGINFSNDEGTIQGTIGVTSMDEKTRDWFHDNRDNVIGKVIEIQCNDLTQARGREEYALSHPRYTCIREDKDSTDTLERSLELKQLAMELS